METCKRLAYATGLSTQWMRWASTPPIPKPQASDRIFIANEHFDHFSFRLALARQSSTDCSHSKCCLIVAE
ncbi:hypothetical protein OUZ56_009873 [Daphnia magna]|uniref:Uncharacterized protein n=1 Tax=Daphnia magna TaxID=35525 RepID=A0ABR0AH41_9CRUS|nr:hypothetical protein OUZ56_009873 [Daphnia magna]